MSLARMLVRNTIASKPQQVQRVRHRPVVSACHCVLRHIASDYATAR
jgi:hypothetical protein